MVMSSKKIGKMVGADVDKALANISASTPKPDMKDDTIKKAAAPQKAQTFAEAFKAARKDPEAMKRGTFTYGGKSFSTKMAGEGAKKTSGRSGTGSSTAAAPKAATTKAPEVNARTKEFFSKTPLVPKKDTVSAPPKRDNTAAGRRARMASAISGFFGGSDESRARYAAQQKKAAETRAARKPLLLVGDEAREANRRQGTIGGMKKGGSVDGIAIRGKTRAPMKKGK